jgi:hypothetical protein
MKHGQNCAHDLFYAKDFSSLPFLVKCGADINLADKVADFSLSCVDVLFLTRPYEI